MKIFKTYSIILTLTLILGACEKDPVCPPTDNNNKTHNCDTSFNIFGFWGLKTVNTVIFDLVQDSPIDTLDFLYPNNFVLMELGKDFKGYQYQNRNVVDSFNYYFDSTKLIVFRQPLKPTNDTFQIIKFDKSNLKMIQRNKDYTNMIRTESKVSFERQ